MSYDEALKDVIRAILAKEDISKEHAEQALSSLEASFDTDRESAHFSKEIYGAI